MATPPPTRVSMQRPGFTIIELLTSILILGVLMGLLFVAFRTTRRYVSSVNDRAAASAIKMGVSRFVEECGILPPLVRDQARSSPLTILPPAAGAAARFSVYDFSPASSNDDLEDLRDVTYPVVSADNPFEDRRFSERSLPVYLAGACDFPPEPNLPIDGVRGVGMFKAKADGAFAIPASVLASGGAASGRSGVRAIEPLIDLTKGYLTLHQDLSGDQPVVELRDKKQVPVRLYRWVNGAEYEQGGRTVFEVRTLDDLRLPRLVGRKGSEFATTPPDRDVETNTELRGATWAVVMAGPDGAFGDEPLAVLQVRLGFTVRDVDQRKFRINAEKDNIVEVGR
jgi:prepilin-type N-terminal cleavage/methylation domain-containing protein